MGALVAIALVTILVVVALRGRAAAPADVFAGLFAGSWSLGWPRGVQEEDTVRPWRTPRRRRPWDGDTPQVEEPRVEELPAVEELRPRR